MKIHIGFIAFLIVASAYADDSTEGIIVTPLSENIRADIQAGNHASARSKLEDLLSKNQNNYTAVYTLGEVLALEGKYDESLRYLEKARAMKEQANIPDASIYNAIGWTEFMLGDIAAAEVNIKKTLALREQVSPKAQEAALNNLGLIYMYKKQSDKAEASFEEAAQTYNSQYAINNLKLLRALEANKQAVAR